MSRATFHVLFDHLYIFFVEISIQVLAPICFLELPFFRATCVYRQGLYLLGCSHRPYSVTLTSSEAGCPQRPDHMPPAHAFLTLFPNTKGQFPFRKNNLQMED